MFKILIIHARQLPIIFENVFFKNIVSEMVDEWQSWINLFRSQNRGELFGPPVESDHSLGSCRSRILARWNSCSPSQCVSHWTLKVKVRNLDFPQLPNIMVWHRICPLSFPFCSRIPFFGVLSRFPKHFNTHFWFISTFTYTDRQTQCPSGKHT